MFDHQWLLLLAVPGRPPPLLMVSGQRPPQFPGFDHPQVFLAPNHLLEQPAQASARRRASRGPRQAKLRLRVPPQAPPYDLLPPSLLNLVKRLRLSLQLRVRRCLLPLRPCQHLPRR